MNPKHLLDMLELVQKKHQIDQLSDWSEGSVTYFDAMRAELTEVEEELLSGRTCYLEDELGDVLWDYMNLLLNLESEGQISLANVFARAVNKYNERITGLQNGNTWDSVKDIQKQRLAQEHNSASTGQS